MSFRPIFFLFRCLFGLAAGALLPVFAPGNGLSAFGQAAMPVDQLVEKARAGELPRTELSERVLTHAEVDQSSIVNPERLVLIFPGFVDEIGPALVKRVESAVTSGNGLAAEQLKDFALRLLGAKSKYYAQVDRWCSLNFRLKDLVSRGTAAELITFRDSLKSAAEKELFLPLLERFVGQTLVRRVRQDPPFVALKNLADFAGLDSSGAVQRTAAEISAQLAQSKSQAPFELKTWTLDDPPVLALLASTVKAVPESESTVSAAYSAGLAALAGQEKWPEVDALLKSLADAFPDKPRLHNEWKRRAVYAIRSTSPDAVSFGKRRVGELASAGALRGSDRFRFLMKGYYAATLIKVIAIVLVIILVTLGGLLIAGRFFPSVGGVLGKGSERIERMQRERIRRKAKKRGVGYIAPVEADDEYSKLLKKFGLTERASEADIKKAYRKLVKEHHPDAQGTSGIKTDSAGNIDRTFELHKKTYERLLAMRSSLFGGR